MKAIRIGGSFLTNVGSLRIFLHKPALWAVLGAMMAAFSVAASAQQSQMTVTQLGSSACTDGYYFPSIDAAVKKVAFNSFCDLVQGENTDGNSELFVMNVNGSGLKQLTSSVGGLGVINPQISWSAQKIVFASDRDLISGGKHRRQLRDLYHQCRRHRPGSTHQHHRRPIHLRLSGQHRALFRSQGAEDHILVGPRPSPRRQFGREQRPVRDERRRQRTHPTHRNHRRLGCSGGLPERERYPGDSRLRPRPGARRERRRKLRSIHHEVERNRLCAAHQYDQSREWYRQCQPDWTSDAKTVFFRSDIDWIGGNPDLNQEIFRMNVDGTNKVQMTSSAGGFGSTATGINLMAKSWRWNQTATSCRATT